MHPLRVKKLYVLAALEIEKFKKRTLDMAGPDKTAATLLGTGGTATMAATAAQVRLSRSWRLRVPVACKRKDGDWPITHAHYTTHLLVSGGNLCHLLCPFHANPPRCRRLRA